MKFWNWWDEYIGIVIGILGILAVLAILSGLFVSPARAAEAEDVPKPWWIEAQAVSGKNNASKIIGWYERDFTDSIGMYVLVEKESIDNYRQMYGGLTLKPFSWLQVGAGLGRETDSVGLNSSRRNMFFDLNWKDVNVFGTFENGGSGKWRKVTATYAINEKFGIGVMEETFLGDGARFEYNFKLEKQDIQLWGAILRDKNTGTSTIIFAVNIAF